MRGPRRPLGASERTAPARDAQTKGDIDRFNVRGRPGAPAVVVTSQAEPEGGPPEVQVINITMKETVMSPSTATISPSSRRGGRSEGREITTNWARRNGNQDGTQFRAALRRQVAVQVHESLFLRPILSRGAVKDQLGTTNIFPGQTFETAQANDYGPAAKRYFPCQRH